MPGKPYKEFLDSMARNLNNWKGPIYYNQKDARLWVPKRHPSLGWTLNFANAYTYIIMAGIIVIIVGSILIGRR